MDRRLKNAVETWLKAESGDDPNRAETALRRVFLRLPLPMPPADLLDHVLAALGFERRRLFASPFWRVAAALCLTVAALVSMVLPGLVGSLWTGFGPGKAIDVGADLLVATSARVAEASAVWETLSGTARLVSPSLTSPTMMTLVVALALVSALALRLLHGLLISERNAHYA